LEQEDVGKERLKKLRKRLEEEKVDALLVSGKENIFYLSGFTGDYAFLLITDCRQIILVDSRFTEQAKSEAQDWELKKFNSLYQDLSALFEELRVRFIGFESHRISYADYKELERNSPSKVFIPLPFLVEKIRAVKDGTELEKIRESIKISESALSSVLKQEVEGKTEREIAWELEWKMRTEGADKIAFDLIVASGFRSALPHGVASGKTVSRGESLLFDWGAMKDFYCSDLTRTFFIHDLLPRQREIYFKVKETLEETLLSLGPGRSCREIYNLAFSHIQDSAFRDFVFGHGLGHGVGLEVHELPFLSPRSQEILEPGMVITVEPGIYIPGWGGVRLEDMVLITEKGAEVLTFFPREINVI
jgi:Xaa-Pro aminopeptidase